MVNNNNSKIKKGGSWYNPFSSDENLDSCKAKCDKKYAVAPSKGMFSWFPSFGNKKEANQTSMENKQQPPNQMGGKRRSKGSKKTRRNKKHKGTRKSSR